MDKKLNFVFWGTPEVASKTLQVLKENGYLPSLIVTAPDRPRGRKMKVTPPPVKVWAIENNISYIQPEKLNIKEIRDVLGTLHPLFFLVVAYGKIMPEEIINIPRLGSINVHYSLLPKYRGASPVESAILNDETETGITIQRMVFKLDSGPILAQEKIKILPDEKAPELRQHLTKIGARLLVKILPEFINEKTKEIPQSEKEATFCKKIQKEDGQIDLDYDPIKNYNKFRAYAEWPRIFFFQNNKRIIITEAILENREFKILKVLPEGKKEIKYEEFKKINTSR